LASFFVEDDAQEFALIGDQWVDGTVAVSIVGALQPIHEGWPGLGVKQEREAALDGLDNRPLMGPSFHL
jgi:hypothetical protein